MLLPGQRYGKVIGKGCKKDLSLKVHSLFEGWGAFVCVRANCSKVRLYGTNGKNGRLTHMAAWWIRPLFGAVARFDFDVLFGASFAQYSFFHFVHDMIFLTEKIFAQKIHKKSFLLYHKIEPCKLSTLNERPLSKKRYFVSTLFYFFAHIRL